MEDITGKILNERYRVEEKLGEGGMAYIYKAMDTKLERTVVLKVLKEEMAKDPEFLGRFKREAQSVAKLNHPNILTVYDIGEENGINYIVMEYFDAASLKDITKGKILPFNKIYDIATKILDALSYAHENGIVHRDIKPHNILINQDNVLKVTDFGIAKAFTSDTLTSTGSILGSVHYFSPEQAQGKPVDETSDIYSLGVMLYELATGKLPFEGDSPVAVALKHVQESPLPPAVINPSISPAFEKIILKAMEKDPGKRYHGASEMMKDIAGLSQKSETSPPAAEIQEPTLIMKPSGELRRSLKNQEAPVSMKGSSAGWWVVLIILLLVIAGGGYFYWTRYIQEI
ncbi:MAG: protein kinase, partial [Firmicutes bacterium]|nr:protein kinase [Bacillota bacterium]